MSEGVGREDGSGRDGTEIDIAEFPWRDGRFTINLHWDGYGKAHQHAGTNVFVPAITNGFHEFALLWTTNEYVFYVDGRELWRTAAGGVSQRPEWAKFSNEIGSWAGDIRKAKLPDDFLVDYIRVYDAVPAAGRAGGK
jgi:beta-glucanase (GH16 family)